MNVQPTSNTKRCPFCAEEIQPAAIKCKHCGSKIPLKSTPLSFLSSTLVVGGIVILLFVMCSHQEERSNTSAASSPVPEKPVEPETALATAGAQPTAPSELTAQPAASPPPRQTTLKVTPAALAVGYGFNEVRMQQRIGKKAVQLTGLAASIDQDFLGNPVLRIPAGNQTNQISVQLDKSEAHKAAKLHPMQTVTVRCKSMSLTLGDPYGSDCTLEDARDTPDVAAALIQLSEDYVAEFTRRHTAPSAAETPDKSSPESPSQ